jgi:hypothetical protein
MLAIKHWRGQAAINKSYHVGMRFFATDIFNFALTLFSKQGWTGSRRSGRVTAYYQKSKQTDGWADRQTWRQAGTDRRTYGCTNRQTYRHKNMHIETWRHACGRYSDRQTGWEVSRQKNRKTDCHTDKQMNREKGSLSYRQTDEQTERRIVTQRDRCSDWQTDRYTTSTHLHG